jgi:hypothetical protein
MWNRVQHGRNHVMKSGLVGCSGAAVALIFVPMALSQRLSTDG